MAHQPPKCCCCVPLRPGLLAWAYIKLESHKLLLVFVVSSLFEVIFGGLAIGYSFFDMISFYYRHPEYYYDDGLLHFFIYSSGFYLEVIGPIVVNMLLPIYFMVLTESELRRLKTSRGGTRVVLNKHVTMEQGKIY